MKDRYGISKVLLRLSLFRGNLWTLSTLILGIIVTQIAAGPQSRRPVFRSEFRYVVLSDKVYDATGKKDMTRSIQVLMDDKAFSVDNLTKLFKLLLKRYPKPNWMDVSVVTSLEQVATPEESEREMIMSHTNNHPEYDRYNNAVLLRQGENVFFRYTINPPKTEMKTVVLKGCDAATSQCAK